MHIQEFNQASSMVTPVLASANYEYPWHPDSQRHATQQSFLFCLCFMSPNSIKRSNLACNCPSCSYSVVQLTMRWKRGRTWPLSCPALSAPPPASCCCTAAECFLHRTSPGPSWRWSRSLPAGLWCPLHPPGNNIKGQQSHNRAARLLWLILPGCDTDP